MSRTQQRSSAYILLDDVDGQTEVKRGLIVKNRAESVNFLRGELVVREPEHKQPTNLSWMAVQSFNPKGRYAVVPREVLGPLTEKELHLLGALPYTSDRYAEYQNKHLEEAEYYEVHSKVFVTFNNQLEPAPGVVWYSGPVKSLGDGTVFGVELLADPPRGNCDGTFQGERYFTCPPNCGVFVAFDKLRLCKSDEEFARRVATFGTKSDIPTKRLRSLAQREEQQPQGRVTRSQQELSGGSAPEEGVLRIGMAVVVFQDGGGQFKGHVRWLGNIYVQHSQKVKGRSNTTQMAVAGIEMDNKRDVIVGLEGMDAQKHARFQAKHGGQKVYLPVESVMPLPEYTDSLPSTPQKGATKEQSHQQQEQSGPTKEQSHQQQEQSGPRKPSGASKEDKDIEGAPRHLLGGLDTTEVMQQQLEVMSQAAQHKQKEPPQPAGANNHQHKDPQSWQSITAPRHLLGGLDTTEIMRLQLEVMSQAAQHKQKEPPQPAGANNHQHRDPQSWQSITVEKETGRKDKEHQQDALLKRSSTPQDVKNAGRTEVQTRTTGMHSQDVMTTGRNELQPGTTGMHGQGVKNNGRNELPTGATGMQYANVVPGPPRALKIKEVYPHIANEQQIAGTSQQEEFVGSNLDIGSAVEVKADPPLYGAIKWIGYVETPKGGSVKVAGIELDDQIQGGTDGTYQGKRYFWCRDGCGWFVPAQHCVRDKRFSSPQLKWPSKVTDTAAGMRDRASEARGLQGAENGSCVEKQLDIGLRPKELHCTSQSAKVSGSGEVEQWKEQVTQLTKERDNLQQQLVDERREHLDSSLALQQQLNDENRQLQKGKQHLQRGNQQLQEDKQQLQRDNQQLQEDKQQLQRDNQQLQEDKQLLLTQLSELHQQLSRNGDELSALQDRHSTLQRAYTRLSQPQQLQSYNIPAGDVTILGSQLGGGSYGVVWKGVWRGIKVAVKRFHEELRVSEHNRKLFRQELDNCAYLRHPNIVTFCGATLENDNPLQIITELLEGSLDELIKAAVSCARYLTHGEQVHLAECTAAGITYLHQRQPTPFVHCDIRPSNILVTRDMSAKVGDLGGSHVIGASTSAGPLSINYTAPERIGQGGQRSESSPSSDVYCLGVTLTELFTGEAAVRSQRDAQLTMIGNVKLQNLCIEATADVSHKRPTAAQLLVRLQQLKACEESCHVRRIVMGKVEGDAIQLVPHLETLTQNEERQQPQGRVSYSQSKSGGRVSPEGGLQIASMRNRTSEASGVQGGFGPLAAEQVPGAVQYPKAVSSDVCGRFKGIQGHHNSCYIDAILFSMYYATYVFDTTFNRQDAPGQKQDVCTELRGILKERIVNPLRRNFFVRADQVIKLFDKLGEIDGFTCEEKDPEEFLNTLLHVFKEEPYLVLRSETSTQESYMYQLFVEKDEKVILPTVQRLLEQAFMGGDLKLAKFPGVLILQMPRFSNQFKLYDRIFPSPTLRINDITDCCKRQCVQCQEVAEYECKECSFNHISEAPCFCASFCKTCCTQIHKHYKRKDHRWKDIRFGQELELCEGEELELFAVVCIEGSHYVSFVKFEDNEWVFFDSMADQKGGQDGYNIPCVTHLPDLPLWLNDPDRVHDTDLRDIPNPIRRMFVDAYMCMYIAPNESMY